MQEISTERYHITITSDSRFDLSLPEHPDYDVILNPDEWQPDENYTAARITVETDAETKRIALIGPITTDFNDCAILRGGCLLVLMGSGVTEISLSDPASCRFFPLDPDGYTHGIFACEGGCLILSTYSLIMEDMSFNEVWRFSTDAPVTSCVIGEDRIILIDEDDNRHHVGFSGRRVN